MKHKEEIPVDVLQCPLPEQSRAFPFCQDNVVVRNRFKIIFLQRLNHTELHVGIAYTISCLVEALGPWPRNLFQEIRC